MAGSNWIKGAIKHPGAFTAEAKAHGKSVAAFASYVGAHKGEFSGTTRRRASLAKTLRGFAKRRKS